MVVGGWAAAVRAQPARGGRCTCIRTCDAQQHCRMPQMLAQPLQPACGMAGTGRCERLGHRQLELVGLQHTQPAAAAAVAAAMQPAVPPAPPLT